MPDFFNAADLGPAYTTSADGKLGQTGLQLKSYLGLLLTEGITSASIMTMLFNIYAKNNSMEHTNNKYLKATDLMSRILTMSTL